MHYGAKSDRKTKALGKLQCLPFMSYRISSNKCRPLKNAAPLIHAPFKERQTSGQAVIKKVVNAALKRLYHQQGL